MVRIPSGTAFSSQPASDTSSPVFTTPNSFTFFFPLSLVCVCECVCARVCLLDYNFFLFLSVLRKKLCCGGGIQLRDNQIRSTLAIRPLFSGLEGRIRRGKRNRRVIFPEGLMDVVRVVGATGFRDGGFEALYLAFNGGIRLSLPSVWGANQIGSANMARRTLPERLAVHQHPTSRGTLGGLDSITANQPVEQKLSFSSKLGAVPKDYAHCFDRFPPQSHL